MKFSELPEWSRVRLTGEGRQMFWHRVDEFGGVQSLSDTFGYPASKMYNWRSKGLFLPIDLVRKVFGNEASDDIVEIKGRGRSKAIREPVIPLPESDELLTRIDESVTVNSNGTPVYQTDDRGNAERFIELLGELGDVPYTVYVRDTHEVRYPKFLQQLLEEMSYDRHLSAVVDESGSVGEDRVTFPGDEIAVTEFDGELFHRDKRLQLALARSDSEEIQELMENEVGLTQNLF